ncbi:hypothetical protein QAD02_005673 [Eretmocerus hayati]|uniref:Uncharacterized protein n=1 Tax=Eretmocerus hayati TaxID=131215 RepID=A0ACC2NUX1_9HYME|nr:hypothetical protein QAD02_005673 [Eretmocerus hayati]
MASSESTSDYVTNDYHIQTSTIFWQLKRFDFTRKREGKVVIENKNISPSQHPCKLDLSLAIDERNTQTNVVQSILRVRLYNVNGPKTKFLITVYLESSQTGHVDESFGTKDVNLTFQDEETATFLLPPFKYSSRDIRTTLNSHLKDNILTVKIKIEGYNEICKVENITLKIDEKNLYCNEKFIELYKKQELVDTTFFVGQEKQVLRAHSVILAAACPYFLSMFSTCKMKEKNTLEVDLSDDLDITFQVFQGFLDCVYGVKKVEQMSDIIMELAVLADKYDCCQLHKQCESLLCESLQKDNVLTRLVFAHRYNYKLLKEKSFRLLPKYGSHLEDFTGVKELVHHPELMGELIINLSK